VRRRYEGAARLPDGFVAIGDAICTLNASYAQGMSVAAAQAGRAARMPVQRPSGLTRRFFAATRAILDAPWDMSVGGDLGYPHVEGRRTVKTRLIGRYVARVLRAAGRDERVARAFLRVANLMAPPPSLFAPAILGRVLRYGGPWRGRTRTGAPARSARTGAPRARPGPPRAAAVRPSPRRAPAAPRCRGRGPARRA
jgi:hypothetical protein